MRLRTANHRAKRKDGWKNRKYLRKVYQVQMDSIKARS